jgi:type IV secretory pathway VirD2 relaxase
MGLATEIDTGRWMVSPEAEPILRELGERGDIIKTMHRALEREGLDEDRHPSRYVLHHEKTTERIVGRVLDKGLGGDEMGERVRLVIEVWTGASIIWRHEACRLYHRAVHIRTLGAVV